MGIRRLSRISVALLCLFMACQSTRSNAADDLVKDGRPQARIVVAAEPTRMQLMAAFELRNYVRKITGAELPVTNAAARAEDTVNIFVGDSPGAADVAVTSAGLDHGAYRIASGDGWLAFVGNDADFQPIEPWARFHGHGRNVVLPAWDELTGAKWSNVAGGVYRGFSGKAGNYDPDAHMQASDCGEIEFWRYDKRGSLNAVHAFLRDLGVRWYMPGELGEIVPTMAAITVPEVDRVVQPDIKSRSMSWDRYHAITRDQLMWSLRLGLNKIFAPMHHGLRNITSRDEQKEMHPEWLQLVRGRRTVDSRRPKACLSSRGLFAENVRFVRTMFDHYKVPMVSVMPHDGFVWFCECPLCEGKDTRERSSMGRFSDYVWDYVVRVADEVARTHPEGKIICGAYSGYRAPPLDIAKLPDNVLVQITNGRPRTSDDPDLRREMIDLRTGWLEKTDNQLAISINYHVGYVPFYLPHLIAQGLRDEAGQVWREDIWMHPFSNEGLYAPGVNHLSIYVMSRLWWEQMGDVDELLDEYYGLYYGPARKEMQAFIEYCEAHYGELTEDKQKVETALALFDAAQDVVAPESVYGRRLALVDDYLDEMRKRKEQLGKGRENVPLYRRTINLHNDKFKAARETLVMDGKLDEPFWTVYPHGGRLRDLVTGKKPEHNTTFLSRWYKNHLYFGIRCEDVAGDPVNIGTTEDGNQDIWKGDFVEILLETDEHSYYQLVVNPAGALVDLDRGVRHWFEWSSEAEVAAHVGEDYWSVEVRIPITQATDDPLHQVIGEWPKASMPWFFNVCRERRRGEEVELSAFSPTGEPGFHYIDKFAKLYVR